MKSQTRGRFGALVLLVVVAGHPGPGAVAESAPPGPPPDLAGTRTSYDLMTNRAHAVVHPTNADINPMVLIEAGYFGCPAISSRICGLPEIVEDGVSGILLNAPPSVEDVTTAMERLLTGDQVYRGMRQAARARMLMLFSREVFENRVRKYLNEVLPADAL